jgi:hypothetical protein
MIKVALHLRRSRQAGSADCADGSSPGDGARSSWRYRLVSGLRQAGGDKEASWA